MFYERRNVYTIRRARWYVAGKEWKIVNVEVKGFVFSLNVSFILIFRCTKSIQKALFSKFCLLEIIVRPFISLMTKFKE